MLIARERAGLHRKDVDKFSWTGLATHAGFLAQLVEAKSRISRMEFRDVEEADQIQQALLEIYAATAPKAGSNEFEMH